MFLRLVRRAVNIGVLFSALVLTPLLFAAHFSAGLAEMLGDFASNYLPNTTLLAKEKTARKQDLAKERRRRLQAASERGRVRRNTTVRRSVALDKGSKILVRGSATMAVGLVPVVGLTADVYSLAEDYSDVCELLQIIDEMSASLGVEGESLYRQNYCHKPEEGMELIKARADQLSWP